MKVLFLSPLISKEKMWGKYSKEGGFVPPIGILSIASYLEKQKHNVKIIDPLVQKITKRELLVILKKEAFELIGISGFTNTIEDTYKTVRFCKEALPEAKIVVGGIHATVLPQQTMEECREIDYLIMGEGEVTMGELLEQFKQKEPAFEKISGLCFRTKKREFVINKKREVIADLDSLPMPAYHLLDMSRYVPHPTQYKLLPSFPVIAQRGCPFNCAFCSAHFVHGKKLRSKSVDNLISEIEFLISRYGAKGIHFQDSTFTIDKNYVIEFCREIIHRNLKFKWDVNTRVDCVDKELLKLMKASGLWMINFGLESGNQNSLDLLGKGITLSQSEKAVRMTRELRIITFSTWILGLPGEDEKMVRQTIKFAKKIGTELALFYLPIPYPGTQLMETCQMDGGLKNGANWEDYSAVDFSRPVYVNPLLGEKKMKEMLREAFLTYYFSPKILWRNLRTIKDYGDLKRYWRGLRALIYGWLI